MISKKISTSVVSLLAAASLMGGFVALPALADTTVGVTASTSVKLANQQQQVAKIIAQSDKDITARITSLNNLNTRIQSMKNVSATVKSNLSAEVQTNITGLTSLKAKIDGETDLPTLRSDSKSIFTAFRIYALVIPRGYIVASSDRITTIDGLMTTLSAKLQARITADQSAGKDVSALQTALADLNAKVADSGVQGQNALNGVSSLVPDQGNAAVIASNHTALLAARANIKTGSQDLQTARQDAQTIVKGLKALNVKTSTTPTTH
ncbi:MAG: hypothetical protein JO026_00380 [Patescibacteria group bacterium]|nr:hypothetical protein [Patescibacteria group bacterium]